MDGLLHQSSKSLDMRGLTTSEAQVGVATISAQVQRSGGTQQLAAAELDEALERRAASIEGGAAGESVSFGEPDAEMSPGCSCWTWRGLSPACMAVWLAVMVCSGCFLKRYGPGQPLLPARCSCLFCCWAAYCILLCTFIFQTPGCCPAHAALNKLDESHSTFKLSQAAYDCLTLPLS